MDDRLNPIRVRGRRKKRVAPDNDNHPDTQPKRRGRPLLPPGYVPKSKSSKQSRLFAQTVKPTAKDSGKRLSRLETLPVEILEKIFLYSLNVNLPRVSPSIAAAVTSERIYRVLILLAFWDDSDDFRDDYRGGAYHGARISRGYDEIISRILHPLGREYTALPFEERKRLQSSILRCRWCTFERIRRQLPNLARLIVRRRWINTGFEMEDGQLEVLEDNLAHLGDDDDDELGSYIFTGAVPPLDDPNAPSHRDTLTISQFGISISCASTQSLFPLLSVKDFPPSLLRGDISGDQYQGFTESHSTFLQNLRILAAFNRMSPSHVRLLRQENAEKITFPREALQQGIHNALVTENAPVLSTLLKLDEFYFRSLHTPDDDTQRRNGIEFETPLYTIPADHFRTAARVCREIIDRRGGDHRNSTRLFRVLLHASAESLPADDPEITQFAMDVGGALGSWLLDLMMELPHLVAHARENPRRSMFYLWSPQGEMAGRYVQEISEGRDAMGCVL